MLATRPEPNCASLNIMLVTCRAAGTTYTCGRESERCKTCRFDLTPSKYFIGAVADSEPEISLRDTHRQTLFGVWFVLLFNAITGTGRVRVSCRPPSQSESLAWPSPLQLLLYGWCHCDTRPPTFRSISLSTRVSIVSVQ